MCPDRAVVPSFILVAITACVGLLAFAPESLAHSVHQSLTPSDTVSHVHTNGNGWWASLYQQISTEFESLLHAARTGDQLGPFLAVILLAIGYGILHAAGPGHGKLILASYLAATGGTKSTGVAIAFIAALIQALLAITIVLIITAGLQTLADAIPVLQNYASTTSLLLIGALGLMIVLRQLAALNWMPQPAAQLSPVSSCSCCGHGGHANAASHHHHEPDAQTHPHSLGVFTVALSMGARPCTSAFVILLLALANDLMTLGIIATLAMGFGVACTLSMVAFVSVDVRERAGSELQRRWLPHNTVSLLSLSAGSLLTAAAITGLVR